MNILTPLQNEVAFRLSAGDNHVTLAELTRLYADLGYWFDDAMACTCNVKYLTGDRAGESYPCKTLYPIEIDTGLSAWNVEARRDLNFNAMQSLRDTHFATSSRFIIEV